MSHHGEAQGNGPVTQLKGFENIYWVEGLFGVGMTMKSPRTMVIIKEEGGLTLVNPVRLNAQGESEMALLGPVKRVVNLGNMHGMDVPYYAALGAEIYAWPSKHWDPEIEGVNRKDISTYPNVIKVPGLTIDEGVLYLADKKILIAIDIIQNYDHRDPNDPPAPPHGFMSPFIGKLLGFKGTASTPPMMAKLASPDKKYTGLQPAFDMLAGLDYDTLLVGHGAPILKNAKQAREAWIREKGL